MTDKLKESPTRRIEVVDKVFEPPKRDITTKRIIAANRILSEVMEVKELLEEAKANPDLCHDNKWCANYEKAMLDTGILATDLERLGFTGEAK